MRKATIVALASALAVAPISTVAAQDTATPEDPLVTNVPAEEDDDFPWGLLGLLGLAGLMGLKRRDDDHRDRGTESINR